MSTSIEWAFPGDLDTGTWFGEQFHTIYDQLLPGGEKAEKTAQFLMSLVGRANPLAIELGVGVGQIALPLARYGAVVTGVDASPLMLDACRASAGPADAGVRLIQADIRNWQPDVQADLVYSVGATLNLLSTKEDQARAMRVIASAVRPGGTAVIENYSPAYVRRLHEGRTAIELELTLDGAVNHVDALSLFDEEHRAWQTEYRWTGADGLPGTAIGRVLLTEHDEFVQMASDAGLERRASYTGLSYAKWAGAPLDPFSPTYMCTFAAPENAPPPDRARIHS